MSTAYHLRAATRAFFEERLLCLSHILDLHNTCMNGVTASEAVAWLGMPEGRSNETTVGIMLAKLGYVRYRRRCNGVAEYRLFPAGSEQEGWKS